MVAPAWPSAPREASGILGGSQREYWSEEFYEAVEQAFETVVEATGRVACLNAKKEKTRIREKIRKAGQACDIAKLGAEADLDTAIQDFVQNALMRLSQVDSPWFDRFPWVEPFAVFAWKVWPEFSQPFGQASLRQAIQKAVGRWLEENLPGSRRPAGLEAATRPEGLDVAAAEPPQQPLPAGAQDADRGRDVAKHFASNEVADAPAIVSDLQCRRRDQGGGRFRVHVEYLPVGANLGATLHGLCVQKLAPETIGSRHLCVGDKFLSVNGRPVETVEEFIDLLRAARPGPIELFVQAGDSVRVVAAEVDASSSSAGADGSVLSTQACARSAGSSAGAGSNLHALNPRAFAGADTRMLILNGEDIGTATLPRLKQRSFAWEAVRKAISYYEAEGFETQTVVRQETVFRCPPPDDLWDMIVQCPALDILRRGTEQSSDRLFVLRLAQTYDCHFVDNTDYCKVEWRLPDHRKWALQHAGRRIQYIFDGFGMFLPLKGTASSAIPTSSTF